MPRLEASMPWSVPYACSYTDKHMLLHFYKKKYKFSTQGPSQLQSQNLDTYTCSCTLYASVYSQILITKPRFLYRLLHIRCKCYSTVMSYESRLFVFTCGGLVFTPSLKITLKIIHYAFAKFCSSNAEAYSCLQV